MCDAARRGFWMTSRAPTGTERSWCRMGPRRVPSWSATPPYGWLELRGAFAFRNGKPDGRTSAEYKQPSPDAPAFGSVAGLLDLFVKRLVSPVSHRLALWIA